MKSILIIFITIFIDLSSSETVQCIYDTTSTIYKYMWSRKYSPYTLYRCDVQNKEIFGPLRATIDRSNGNHNAGKANIDVDSFYTKGGTIKKFPRNLEKVFPNLVHFRILEGNLNAITRNDLRHFTKLKYLNLYGNKIAAIYEDLFELNPLIEQIYLDGNQIVHIDETTFNNLGNLQILYLSNNDCSSLGNTDNRADALALIRKIEDGQCQNVLAVENSMLRKQLNQQQEENYNQTIQIHKLVQKLQNSSTEFNNLHQRYQEVVSFTIANQNQKIEDENSNQ